MYQNIQFHYDISGKRSKFIIHKPALCTPTLSHKRRYSAARNCVSIVLFRLHTTRTTRTAASIIYLCHNVLYCQQQLSTRDHALSMDDSSVASVCIYIPAHGSISIRSVNISLLSHFYGFELICLLHV